MESVIYIIANIFVLFAFDKFMKVFFENRKTGILLYLGSCLLYPLVVGRLFLTLSIPVITMIANVIVIFIITLNFDATWKRRFSAVLFIYVFMLISDAIVTSASGYFNISVTEHIKYSSLFGIVSIHLMIYLEALLAQNFKSIRKSTPISSVFWISSFIIPVSSIFMTMLILSASNINQILIVFAVIIIFLINILTFYLHDSLSEAYSDKLESTLLTQEKEYYYSQCELMRETTEEIKSFRHDVKNHLSVVCEYVKGGNTDEALVYLSKLIGNVSVDKNYSETGNIAFDSVINYKLRNAKADGIELSVSVSVPLDLNIEVFDVVTIVGNLLDNAVNR